MRKSSARLKARGEGGVGGATIYEIFKTWEHTTHRCLFVSCTYYLLPLIDIVIFCTIAIIVLIVITKRNLLRYVSMTLRTRQNTIHDTFYPSTRTRPYILTSSCRLPDVHRWCVVAWFFPRFNNRRSAYVRQTNRPKILLLPNTYLRTFARSIPRSIYI